MRRARTLVSAATTAALLATFVGAPAAHASNDYYSPPVANGRIHAYINGSGVSCPGNASAANAVSLAGVALSFGSGIAAITGATALSLLGIGMSSTNVTLQTCVSHTRYYRDGQGWVGYWHTGYRTGRELTYKHIYGARWDPALGRSVAYAKNYSTPSKYWTSANYYKSNAWLSAKGLEYAQWGQFYSETPF